MADLDNDLINQLTEQFRELNRNMILQNSSAKPGEAASLLHTLSESEKKARLDYLTNFKNLTKSELEQRLYDVKKSKELNERQREVLTEQLNLEIQRKNIAEQAKQSTKVLIGSLGNLTKAFNDISGDVTKFNSTISTVGDQALAMGKQFGTAGTAVGAFVKSLTFLTTVTLDQTQKLLKGFDDLSSVGATTSLTTKQILELGSASGYSVANLEKFTKNFTQLGTDLANLGGTASLGAKTFSQITAVGNKTYEAFNRLGISQEQLTEAQAGYVRQAAMSNAIGRKDTVELRKASLDYVEQLVKLRDLTGMNIQQQQQALEAAMAQENFNAYVNSREIKIQEIEEQIRNEANAQRKEELIQSKKAIEAELEQKKRIAIATSKYSENDKTAILQAMSTAGEMVMTEQIARVQGVIGINLAEMVRLANAGKDGASYILKEFGRGARESVKLYGELVGQTGPAGIEMRKQLMVGVESLRESNRQSVLTDEQREKEIELIKKNIESRLKEGKVLDASGKPVEDAAKDAQNFLNTASRNLATALDKAVESINPFTGSLGGATLAVGALAGAAYFAAGALGIKGLTGVIGKLLGKIGTAGAAAGAAAGAGAAAAGAGAGAAAARFAKGVAVPVIIAGAAGATTDALMGGLGVGKGEVDEKQDDKNWERMSAFEKAQSGIARGIEHIGEFMFLDNMAKQARIDRIAKETQYFQERDKKTTSPTSLTGKSDTTSTIAEGGQKAVNVNIIGSIPLNVNIEKVLDPLFRLSKAGTGQGQTWTAEDERLAEIVREAASPNRTAAASSGPPPAASSMKFVPPIESGKSFQGSQKEFTDQMQKVLIEAAKKAGVANPEVIAKLGTAQSALETGYGKSLAGGNNYFGIKDFSGQGGNLQSTKEFINGQWVNKREAFKTYGSMEESAEDYVKFLQKNPRYKDVLSSDSPEKATRAIQESGYATDPSYETKLRSIISRMQGASSNSAPAAASRPIAPVAATPTISSGTISPGAPVVGSLSDGTPIRSRSLGGAGQPRLDKAAASLSGMINSSLSSSPTPRSTAAPVAATPAQETSRVETQENIWFSQAILREKDPETWQKFNDKRYALISEFDKSLANDDDPGSWADRREERKMEIIEELQHEFFEAAKKVGAAGKSTQTYAKGGMILGPGTSTSDSVPAFNKDTGQPIALSTGEYVLPAGVTSILGKGYLDSLISSPDTLRRQAGGIIPGSKASDKQRELDKLIANIDTILGSGTGLKRQGFSLVEDSSSGIIGVSGSMASESKSMIEATLAKAEDISKRYNVLPTPDPVPIIKASDVTDADFGVSSEMAMPTSNDASQFKFDRAAMLKDTETFQRQQGENLGLSSSQLVDPMREALTPMLDKQDETNKNMLGVLQNVLSVLESSTSIQSNMLNYARM